MSSDPDLWPDAVTLSAGDEGLDVEPYPVTPLGREQMRGYQEPGDLAVLAYVRDHPEGRRNP